MKLQDLGTPAGEMIFFGGPYSNRQATAALLAEARGAGIPAARTICTGDVVAYCADPAATVALVRAAGVPVVAGNCETQLAADAGDCGCGFEAGSTCDLLSAGWYGHARAGLDADARGWMAGLPDILTLTHAGRRVAVLHAGATRNNRFLWPVSPEAEFVEEIAALTALAGPVDRVIAGHCGIPFRRRIGTVEWINAGVIGMPANDGTRLGWYLRLGGDGAPAFRRLAYAAEEAAAGMRAAGLTQGYDAALLSGHWPSQDVLPPAMRRADPRRILSTATA